MAIARICNNTITGLPGPMANASIMRSALRRVNGFLKNMIEAIADSKMRRIERELELRGFRFDPLAMSGWCVISRPMERSQ